MKNLRLLASGAAFMFLVAGCASGPKHEAPPPAPTPAAEAPAKTYTIQGVNFAFDSARLTQAGEATVAEAAASIKATEGYRFNVIGHTDSKGTDAYNQRLSEHRAKTVMKALIRDGVSRDQLTASGMGERQPIADNSTAAGRAENRRVEITPVQ